MMDFCYPQLLCIEMKIVFYCHFVTTNRGIFPFYGKLFVINFLCAVSKRAICQVLDVCNILCLLFKTFHLPIYCKFLKQEWRNTGIIQDTWLNFENWLWKMLMKWLATVDSECNLLGLESLALKCRKL